MPVRVGDRGTAVTPLYPSGTILIGSERCGARSESGMVESGCEVVAVGESPFGLIVRPAEEAEKAGTSPPVSTGRSIPSRQERAALAAQELRRQEEEQLRQEAEQSRRNRRRLGKAVVGGAVGGAAGCFVLAFSGLTQVTDNQPLLTAALVAAGGGAFFAGWLYILRSEPACVLLGLVGLVGGGVIGTSALGLLPGVLSAFGAGFAMSLLIIVNMILQGSIE